MVDVDRKDKSSAVALPEQRRERSIRMSKSIIFCADGTWNSPGDLVNGKMVGEPTNVFKLYFDLEGTPSQENINLKEEQEKSTASGTQVAKYIHGVGDSANPLVKLMGGAVGAGTVIRILRGYTYISRKYKPGDKIFIVGFSRGAYTVRALTGLIASCGLLDARSHDLENKDLAYRLAASIWYGYRKKNAKKDAGLLSKLQSVVMDFPYFFQSPIAEPHLISDISIDTVAVWDTVGALGVPVLDIATGYPVDVFKFANTALSPQVANGIHFISVDEQRTFYTPTLWHARQGVEQVLYPGAHADVGGGYSECDLSDCSLNDMQALLAARGLCFANPPHLTLNPNPLGLAHTPWLDPGITSALRAPRLELKNIKKSACLIARLQGGLVSAGTSNFTAIYAPTNI
ncbi:DUF2235 domain-containing protein [Agrobacterium vitis]|uniref:DUF2235 domain-containing protein n=1 Tax=Agrobacterium vitis TaxID=373 RepID=UPI0012E82171|nr:DUF2235 domain-containing protein [Agrobacterium vitis]MUZ64117.1 DUF2235 domain-containing protein [Agrobacterium vitis]